MKSGAVSFSRYETSSSKTDPVSTHGPACSRVLGASWPNTSLLPPPPQSSWCPLISRSPLRNSATLPCRNAAKVLRLSTTVQPAAPRERSSSTSQTSLSRRGAPDRDIVFVTSSPPSRAQEPAGSGPRPVEQAGSRRISRSRGSCRPALSESCDSDFGQAPRAYPRGRLDREVELSGPPLRLRRYLLGHRCRSRLPGCPPPSPLAQRGQKARMNWGKRGCRSPGRSSEELVPRDSPRGRQSPRASISPRDPGWFREGIRVLRSRVECEALSFAGERSR